MRHVVFLLAVFFSCPAFSQGQTFGEKIWWKTDPYGMRASVEAALGKLPSLPAPAGIPGAAPAGAWEVLPPAGGWPDAAAKTRPPGVPGGPAVDVRVKIKPAAAAAAIGKFASRIAYPITVGVALYNLCRELGFSCGNGSDGSVEFSKADPAICSVAPCFSHFFANQSQLGTSSSPAGLCPRLASIYSASGGRSYAFAHSSSANFHGFGSCSITETYQGSSSIIGYESINGSSVAPLPVVMVPASQQDFESAIASRPGWPSSSAITRVIADAIKAGEPLQVDSPRLTGPASLPGQTSKVTRPDGAVTTNTTTNNYTYQGDKITYNVTTVSVTHNPATGETTTETSESGPEDAPVPDDTPLPEQPRLYEPKFPDGLEGVWSRKKSELVATPLASLATSLMPDVGSSGHCPVMNVDLTFASWASFGTRDVAPPCYVWDWARLIVLVSALLLARALVFGG